MSCKKMCEYLNPNDSYPCVAIVCTKCLQVTQTNFHRNLIHVFIYNMHYGG